ncbi:MAG: hypothetical protein WC636_06485, partial [Candidatus Margulisiibacteriota bacterium]
AARYAFPVKVASDSPNRNLPGTPAAKEINPEENVATGIALEFTEIGVRVSLKTSDGEKVIANHTYDSIA